MAYLKFARSRILHKLLFGIFVCLASVFALSSWFARIFWDTYSNPSLALLLDRANAPLALEVGIQEFGLAAYNLPLAEWAFRKAVAIESSILWGHYELGRVLFVEGKLDAALEEFNTELKYNPGNFRSFYMRGLTYAYLGHLDLAEADFKTFVQWAPAEWAGYNDLAWVLAQEGKYTEARSVLTVAMQKAGGAATNPWLWNNLGVQNLTLKNYAAAKADFENARKFAAGLDAAAWHKSYPGNDPVGSAQGIAEFQSAIESNLANAELNLP